MGRIIPDFTPELAKLIIESYGFTNVTTEKTNDGFGHFRAFKRNATTPVHIQVAPDKTQVFRDGNPIVTIGYEDWIRSLSVALQGV